MRVIQLLGSAQHVSQIASLLQDEGNVDVRIAAPSSLNARFESIAPVLTVEIADRPRPQDFKVVGQLRALSKSCDVLHAHGLRAAALAGIAHLGLSKSSRARLVVTLHNLPVGGQKVQAISQVLERVVSWTADAVLGVSMDIVERMKALGAKTQGRALVPAPQLTPTSRSLTDVRAELLGQGNTEGGIVILTIARLAPQKGLDTVIEASQRLKTDHIDHVWAVAGDGPLLESLQQKIATTGAPVRLLGRRTDISDLLAAADVVVNAAVWEGQPVAVQEALRAGKAIVATMVGGTEEVTENAALLVPAQRPEIMANAIKDIVTDDQVRELFETRALERAEQLPKPEDVERSLLRVYVN